MTAGAQFPPLPEPGSHELALALAGEHRATLPAIDDSPRRDLRFGGLVAGAFFACFGAFAAFVPLESAAHAPGQLQVVGNRQVVQHPEGGVVSRIMVAEDATVRQGEVLLSLNDSGLAEEVEALSNTAIGLQAQRARLLAERDGAPLIAAPPEFAQLQGEDKVAAAVAMAEQSRVFAERAKARDVARSVAQLRETQFFEQGVGSEQQLAASQEQLRLVEEELGSLKSLLERGFVPVNRVRQLERQRAALIGQIGEQRAAVARAREARGETRMASFGSDQEVRAQVAAELRATEVQLGELLPRLAAARSRLERVHVRAPASGRVVGLAVFTEGGVIAPGQKLMEIVPQNADLIVEARAAPTDADDLAPGLTAEIKVAGLPARELPVLLGTVSAVSADSFVDERSGERYYRMEVTIPRSELVPLAEALGRKQPLKPGMLAEVIVPLRERTLLSYLTEPILKSLWRAFRES